MNGYFDSPESLQATIFDLLGDTVELDELTEYLDDNGFTYVPLEDFDFTYDEMLDDSGTVTVGGLEYYPSRILKEIDPVAYRCGKTDYLDAISDDALVLDF